MIIIILLHVSLPFDACVMIMQLLSVRRCRIHLHGLKPPDLSLLRFRISLSIIIIDSINY